jgi:hypothetical protein
MFVGAIATLYIRFNSVLDTDEDTANIFEATKNTALLFSRTVLPFIIAITSLRYLPFYVQIPLSIIIVILVLVLSKLLKILLDKLIDKIQYKIGFDGIRRLLLGFGITVLVGIPVFFMGTSGDNLNSLFNLQNHKPQYNFTNGYPYDIGNQFEGKLIDGEESNLIELIEYDEDSDPIENNMCYDESYKLSYELTLDMYTLTRVLTRTDQAGKIDTITLEGIDNVRCFSSNNVVYLFTRGSDVVEILDKEFKINNIYIPLNKYSDFYKKVNEDSYDTFVVHNYNNYYELEKQYLDITLPFYSHYSYYHVLFIFITLFIPITDYKKDTKFLNSKKSKNDEEDPFERFDNNTKQ